MKISIIINNYKTKGLLRQCLKGIEKYPPSVKYEVIVVDNNSGDGSVELVRDDFPEIKLIASDENLGHHRGNNLGIKKSSGKYILILNTDIALLDNAIDQMYQFMEDHPETALVGPKLKNPDGSVQMSCMRFPTPMVPIYRRTLLGKMPKAKRELNNYLMTDFDHNRNKEVDWILGACILVRQSAIDRVGLLDEDLFMYFGDIAWCYKFWQSGYKVFYLSGSDVVHYHKRESAQSGIISKVFWIHILDWIKYLKKYPSR